MKPIQDILKDFFRLPTAEALAVTELEDAKRQLLHAQTALDYSKRMVDYHSDRIKRLTAYVANNAPTPVETP